MADDIEVGARLRTDPADIQNAERLAGAVQKFQLTAQQGAEILARVGKDNWSAFTAEVAKLAAAFDAQTEAAERAARATAAATTTASASPAAAASPLAQQRQRERDAEEKAVLRQIQLEEAATREDERRESAIRRVLAASDAARAADERRDASARKLIAVEEAANAEDERRSAQLRRMALLQQQAIQEDQRRDQSFQKIPASARTAANAISLITNAAITGQGSMAGLANAAGSVAFGLANLTGKAALAASAAGIGAVISITALLIELLARATEGEKKQEAALKSFTETNESFAARSAAVADVVKQLGGLAGSTADQVKLVGMTKEIDNLRNAIVEAQREASKDLPATSFIKRVLGEEGILGKPGAQAVDFAKDLRALQQEFLAGGLSAQQFKARLDALGQTNPQFAVQIASSRELIANLEALEEAEQRLTNIELQRRAREAEAKSQFGATPDLDRELSQVNARLTALRQGGADAVKRLDEETKAVDRATTEWDKYIATHKEIAGTTFTQALAQRNAEAIRELDHARQIIAGERRLQEGLQTKPAPDIEAQARAAIQAAKTAADAAVATRTVTRDKEEGEIKAQLAREQITRREFAERERDAQIGAITDVRNLRNTSFDEQQKALAAEEAQLEKRPKTPEREAALTRVRGDETALANERVKANADADAQIVQAQTKFAEEIAAIEKRIAEATFEAQVAILRATGHAAEAQALETQHRNEQVIREIQQSAGKNAPQIKILLDRESVEQAKIAIEGAEQAVAAASEHMQARMAEINALALSHAISPAEARRQILALEKETVAVFEQQLQVLEARNAELHDSKTADEILRLKTRLLEVNETIREQEDLFFRLKKTAVDASESALATFFEGAANLVTGDQNREAIANVRALTTEIDSARQELEALLAIPAEKRTTDENQRISQLRGEIAQTSVQLDDAKQAITGWRDLFLQAAQSIIQALIRVASQMLAVRAIEGLLGLFIGGAAGASATQTLSGDVPVKFLGAEGGPTPDIGRPGHDDILAAVQREEFIHKPAATRYYGLPAMYAINEQRIPRAVMDAAVHAATGFGQYDLRPSVRRFSSMPRFADGGPVGAGMRGVIGGEHNFTHRFEIIAPPGFTARHLDSPEGHQVVIKIIGENPRAVGVVVGPFVGR